MNSTEVLIKSKQRVKENGEVYTPSDTIDDMLSCIDKDFWENNKTFLEPSCGNGNILVKILEKKLSFNVNVLDAVKSIYGIDILEDNVKEARIRMFKILLDNGLKEKDWEEVIKHLKSNIVQGNTLEKSIEEIFKDNNTHIEEQE